MSFRVSLIFGTRPEAIKLCPLVRALRAAGGFEPHVCVTAQHRAMLDQVLHVFDVTPDVDLDLMRPNQTLAQLSARALTAVDGYLEQYKPDLILVQGDTTTVFCAGLAAYYRRIPVGHVEAGLRTGNRQAPYPEEINRVLTAQLADIHFAPTPRARENLLREGVDERSIHVTGNTVIDALEHAVAHVRACAPVIPDLPADLQPNAAGRRLILVTGHRRESFGRGMEAICQALRLLATRYPDCALVYPVHLNPRVREPVQRILEGIRNVHLIEPLDYLPFVGLMHRACIILTDSGGIQEEAPALGKPVLVMRDVTERPEAIEAGTARLVGTCQATIVAAAAELLDDDAAYARMARRVHPFGDGSACRRIVAILQLRAGVAVAALAGSADVPPRADGMQP